MKVNLICANGNVDVNSSKYQNLTGEEKIKKIVDDLFLFCGRMGGECYSSDSLDKIMQEDETTTRKRAKFCLEKMHHSLFEHAKLTLELVNVPKFILMILNNQYVYTTSERSARYTNFYELIETEEQKELYTKWQDKIFDGIEEIYPGKFTEKEKVKLAQENARYMISVFVPSSMVYTVSLRDLNYTVFAIKNFLNDSWWEDVRDENEEFMCVLRPKLEEFLKILNPYIIEGLAPKAPRELGIFNSNKTYNFAMDMAYSVRYEMSFAGFAQEQRHRSIRHSIDIASGIYVPEIISVLGYKEEWEDDMCKVFHWFPQGRTVYVYESGNIEDFVSKCYERVCGRAQLEIQQTTLTTLNFLRAFGTEDVESYLQATVGDASARCGFPGFKCKEPCKFGINQAERKI